MRTAGICYADAVLTRRYGFQVELNFCGFAASVYMNNKSGTGSTVVVVQTDSGRFEQTAALYADYTVVHLRKKNNFGLRFFYARLHGFGDRKLAPFSFVFLLAGYPVIYIKVYTV